MKAMRVLLSVAVFAGVLALAIVPIACTPDCKTGTIAMQIYLNAPIYEDADRVVITSTNPSTLGIDTSVSRTAGTSDGIFLDLAFPHGYVANEVVTIVAQAFAGSVLLGEGSLTIHTRNQCSDGLIYVGPLMTETNPDGGS